MQPRNTHDEYIKSLRGLTPIIKCMGCGHGTSSSRHYKPYPRMCTNCGHSFTKEELNAVYVVPVSRFDILLPRYQYFKHGKKWQLLEVRYPFKVCSYPDWAR